MKSRYITAVQDKPWWLAGGVAAGSCLVAYQPKGAESYAASKVNLANPGKYDAVEGVAPTWAKDTGWTGNAIDMYLTITGLPTSLTHSIIINIVTQGTAAKRIFYTAPDGYAAKGFWYNEVGKLSFTSGGISTWNVGGTTPNGVYALSCTSTTRVGYYDGLRKVAGIPTGVMRSVIPYGILASTNNTSRQAFSDGTIASLAIYEGELTQYQVVALTQAMKAL